MKANSLPIAVALTLILAHPVAADPGSDLAARLNAQQQDGGSFIRLRLTAENSSEIGGEGLQIQIKERRTGGSADVLYQVLYPRERKGEAVLLKRGGGGAPSGYHLVPPDKVARITAADLAKPLFGSGLAYADAIENFFAWENQKIIGEETIDGVKTVILESRPGGGDPSIYGTVRSWIDTDRLVPLRVEKYDRSGQLARRIDATRVNRNDAGHYVPSTLVVRRPGHQSATRLEGSRSKSDVSYSDGDFTVEKMGDLSPR